MKERDGARIERAARQFASSNDVIENVIDNTDVTPGWYPDKESVLATAISDKHEEMLAQMLAHDHKMVEVMKKLDKVHSKSNYAKSIAMATDAIEQNERFVRNLYGGDIPCELHSCVVDLFDYVYFYVVCAAFNDIRLTLPREGGP
jgi:GTPase Era involved in 16S rRNA processing